MADKILTWASLLACGLPALLCILSALACFCTGRFAEGILMIWLGCWPTACTAFVWWCKQKSEEWDKEWPR